MHISIDFFIFRSPLIYFALFHKVFCLILLLQNICHFASPIRIIILRAFEQSLTKTKLRFWGSILLCTRLHTNTNLDCWFHA